MMDTDSLLQLEAAHTSGVYSKRPIAIVRGQGATVWDSDGREYIDCVAGHGTANIGHAHPKLVRAVQRQAEALIACPESFPNDKRALLQAALARITPESLSRVFLCNSGTEAVEGAMKFARLLSGRRGIVAAKGGFHGRTLGALSATWRKQYRQPFEPLVPEVTHVPYNDLEALESRVDDNTAAVLLEVVQGEGGVVVGDGELLQGAQELCQERGALLILDEIQTGFGRTGRMFACERYGLEPDLMCVAKSIAGGLPMGAVLIHDRWGMLPGRVHGSTFGGNPLSCAAALATIEVLEEEQLAKRAEELGSWFREQLDALKSPLVREVRGLGLLVGMQLRKRAGSYVAALMGQGVLALTAGPTVLRFLPPLVVSQEQLAQVVEGVRRVLVDGV